MIKSTNKDMTQFVFTDFLLVVSNTQNCLNYFSPKFSFQCLTCFTNYVIIIKAKQKYYLQNNDFYERFLLTQEETRVLVV